VIAKFSGGTVDAVWLEAAAAFRSGIGVRRQASRAGDTLELLHTVLEVEDPRQRWVTSRRPALNPAFAIAEVVWILRGRRDAAFLVPWNRSLRSYAGDDAEYHGAYGARLIHQFGLDQLDRAWQVLSSNPDSRQVVLQIWDPTADLPNSDGSPRSPDIPCNVCAMPKVRDGRLEWMQVLRSNDLFLGVPYNLIQFTTIQEVLAGWIGVEVGSYVQLSDSLHVYERDLQAVTDSLGLDAPHNPESLALPREESVRCFAELEKRIVMLGSPALERKEFDRVLGQRSLPTAYSNLLLVVAAEAARRRSWSEAASEAAELCSNPVLRTVWHRWTERFAVRD